jgi:uncharacterized protein YkwD
VPYFGDHTRLSGAAVAAALLALVPQTANGSGNALSQTEQAFFVEINKTRGEHGLDRVTLDDRLIDAARFHSNDMVERGYFEHGVFSRRLERFGVEPGHVGEDLGWDRHIGVAVRELVEMWLDSPRHRAILLSSKYREVGIGVAVGPFKGFPKALVVTADFHGP